MEDVVTGLSTPQRTRMATASGQPIVYCDPSQTRVVESDLRTSLSRQCRYNGHVPVSVLQHLVLCVELARAHGFADPATIAYTAAHDLHEAYVSDVVRGLKDCLGVAFADIEVRWERHVHNSLGLTWPPSDMCAQIVRQCDHLALLVEMTAFDFPLLPVVVKQIGRPATTDEMACWSRVAALSVDERWATVWTAVQGAPGDPVND